MKYIGIDNGLNGGLVALGENPGEIIDMIVMPTRGKSKGNEVDGRLISEWLRKIDGPDSITILLETPGKFAKGVQAISSMWDSYGTVRGIIEAFGYRHHRITPQSWQKAILIGCKAGDTKPAALARARQIWPSQNWLRSERCKSPHDGLIDAALIAEYGRIKNL